MPALTWKEKEKQKTLYELGYQYLVQNFHKFSDDQRIKISLEVIHLFNKDGSKDSNRQVVFIVNQKEAERLQCHTLEILPSQITADNQEVDQQI